MNTPLGLALAHLAISSYRGRVINGPYWLIAMERLTNIYSVSLTLSRFDHEQFLHLVYGE